jgi:hypothetical protein
MTTHHRADLPAWIFIGGLSCFPWLIVWADSVHGFRPVDWLVAIIVSGFAFAWLFSFRIIITPTEVRFRSLFRGQQSIQHNQIQKVQLAWNLRNRTRGPFQLIIEPRVDSGVRKLTINAKVFSKAAIDAVLDLGARVAKADDGGLRDGVVMRTWRDWKENRKS